MHKLRQVTPNAGSCEQYEPFSEISRKTQQKVIEQYNMRSTVDDYQLLQEKSLSVEDNEETHIEYQDLS